MRRHLDVPDTTDQHCGQQGSRLALRSRGARSLGTGSSSKESFLPAIDSTLIQARQLMPAVSLGARLFGISHRSSACCARFSAVKRNLVNITIHPNRVASFSSKGTQYTCQSPLISNQINQCRKPLTVVSGVNRFFSTSQTMATNGEVRSKRKKSPIKVLDRPTKIYKQDLYPDGAENGHPPEDDSYSMETDGEDRISLPPITATADSAEWQATIEKVVRNVVSIHFCQTCSFDTDSAISSEATGFVVDAERGYILTNRHVVGAGPFWGYCIFDNHEEVGLYSPPFENSCAKA